METGRREALGRQWGTAVAARRDARKLSQAQLAELCGVTQQTISKIERGLMIPIDDLKLRIARYLATTPQELFAWPPMSELDEAS